MQRKNADRLISREKFGQNDKLHTTKFSEFKLGPTSPKLRIPVCIFAFVCDYRPKLLSESYVPLSIQHSANKQHNRPTRILYILVHKDDVTKNRIALLLKFQ